MGSCTVRILYLADIRFPLERANGIQTMETCHALAARGHRVSLAVRPDTHAPRRDPYAFYGLPRIQAAEHTRATEYTEYTEDTAAEYTEYTEEMSRGALNIEVVPVTGPPQVRRTAYVAFGVGRAMGRVRQDIIFTRDLGIAAILVRLPRIVRAPVVYEAHTIAADEAAARHDMLTGAAPASPSKLRRLGSRDAGVWRAADGYVTITHGLKDELERRFGPRPHVAVVPDGARAKATEYTDNTDQATEYTGNTDQATEYKENTEKRDDPRTPRGPWLVVGYAGHLYPWKGVDLIVEAVAALPDARALIIGGHEQEPDLARVRKLAEDLDCGSRITFTGLLPPPAVAARLREADVLVLPNPASAISNAFTSPLKLFEYMASGRPIVASDLPSIREVLTDGRNALLVQPGNPQALTAAIRRLRDDRALSERLAAQAENDVRAYTWEKRAERLEALFDEVRG